MGWVSNKVKSQYVHGWLRYDELNEIGKFLLLPSNGRNKALFENFEDLLKCVYDAGGAKGYPFLGVPTQRTVGEWLSILIGSVNNQPVGPGLLQAVEWAIAQKHKTRPLYLRQFRELNKPPEREISIKSACYKWYPSPK